MRNLSITVRTVDGGAHDLEYVTGRELINEMVSDDWGAPPTSLVFRGVAESGSRISITIGYDDSDEAFVEVETDVGEGVTPGSLPLHTSSTSAHTAEATDLVLRETTTTRLVFRPLIIDNKHDPAASVKGVLIHQRKAPSGDWEDCGGRPLSSLKSGEGFKLELKSAALLKLVSYVQELQKLHSDTGVPQGEVDYVRVESGAEDLSALSASQFRSFLDSRQKLGNDLLVRLLKWAAESTDLSTTLAGLERLGHEAVSGLQRAAMAGGLELALSTWRENLDNHDEEFWQSSLTSHSFALEQVYSWPVTLVHSKAYMGGKNVFNRGGGLADFLVKNRLSENAGIVEIKTPETPLLGRKYRDGVWAVSPELSGAIVQVLSYRDDLQKDYYHLTGKQGKLFESFSPECAVIAGKISDLDERQRASFELFRRQVSGIVLITFDELISKTERVLLVLKKSDASA